MKNFKLNFKSIVKRKPRWLLTIIAILTLGVGQMWGAAKQRYIYVGISNNYQTWKDGDKFRLHVWGGTDGDALLTLTWVQDSYDHDGRKYWIYRTQVYDDAPNAQFKASDSWWSGTLSVDLDDTNNNAIFFSHSDDGWGGQFQTNYQVTSTASLSASSTSVAIGTNVTLTPSLSSNSDYNDIKSTSYSVSTNPNSGGSVTSAGVFSATKAGSYTVTATVTYNAKDFTGITKTATATKNITVYATVTFDREGGSGGTGSQNATYNSATSNISAPSKSYYDFAGYWTGDDGTGTMVINASGVWQKNISNFTDNSSTAKWIILTNQTLYAKWTPKNYSITYKDQGNVAYSGTNSASLPSSYTYGTGTALTDGVKSGYRFDGWFTTSACTGDPVTSVSSSDNGAKVFYAKWTENPGGTVTLTAGTGGQVSKDGSSWGASKSYTGIKTTDALNIYAQASAGYTFSAWSKTSGSGTITSTSSASTTFTPVANADAALTASFTENKVTLTPTVSYDHGSSNYTASSSNTVGVATTTNLSCSNPNAAHYTFAGWTLTNLTVTSGNAATDRSITVKITTPGSPIAAVANYNEVLTSRWHLVGNSSDFPDGWNINSTTMMQKKTGHSKESVVYFTVDVTSTDTKEFKIVDDNGASDDIWYGYSSGDTYLTWTATATNNVYAKDDGGTDHNKNNLKYTPTVTGPYEFKVDYSGTYPAVTITYPTSYTVTYSVSPAGAAGAITTSPSFSSGDLVLSGTSVTFTHASANSGYTWYRWENGSGSSLGTESTYNTSISANTTVVAKYTENDYTVTVQAGDGGSVSSGSVTGHVSTKVTLPTATPSTGYYFTGWTVTTGTATLTNASSANTAQVNGLTAAATVTANFAPIWALVGTMNSWNPATNTLGNFTTTSSKDYGYVDVDLNANTQYSFKIKNVQTSAFYKPTSSNTEITYANKATAQGMNNTEGGDPNQTIMTAGKGTYRFTWNATDHSIKVTYPTSYTVTFGYGTGGSAVTASVESSGTITSGQYAAAGKDITFTQTPSSSGYTFKGWYTAASGGTAVSGMSTSDNVLDDIAANATVYAQYTANTYTVTFDKNGGTTNPSPSSKSVTFGAAYGELPVATHASRQFVGWYTTASDDPTPGTRVTAETIVSNPSNHTLYARFESTFEVTVTYKCGSDVLYPSNKVYASASSLAADISAPEILGYRFVNWTGSNATFGDASSATTTVNASALTTITANYEVVPTVYFKNNLGWDSVFVTFDCSFIAGKQNVPSNNGHPYFAMTQLGSTDIFYCEIPSTYTSSDYAEWAWNIAFDNTNYGKTATTTHTGTWDFYGGECVGRGDFDPKATMFIPFNGDTETRNTATFYKTGCWMKYNSTDPGYQVKVNQWVTGANSDTCTVSLSAPVAGGYEFSGKVWLKAAGYGYGFKLYKPYLKNTNDLWYSNNGSIHSNTTTLPWEFATKIIVDEVEQAVTADTRRCELYTEAKGDYEFTVSFATGKPVVNVTYPVSAGDYRLVYNDNATWSNDAHDASWIHPSRVIKAKANAEDIVSFYIAYGSSPSILLQKCTSIDGSGNPVWNAGTSVTIGATAKGIYNYKVTQDGSKNATVTFDGSYNGNFYVRTDVSDGGWSNYKTSGTNTMTYSEYAEDNYDFTHYFMRFVNKGLNIKFCIANDYSECISDTLVSDSYTNEWIEAYANVRFMWDHRTNKISRAYISGSSNISDRFLVLEGSTMMYDEDGNALTGVHQISGLEANEMKFIDDQNWIYEATIKANPKAKALLTAKYNGKIQYFGGSGPLITDSVLLIGGSDANKYKIRVVYDFKTNRLLKAFIPDGAITSDLAIETDLMIIRDHQEDAKQVTFDGGSLSKVKTVYGAMMFNKWTVNNKHRSTHETLSLSRYERDLFYISFPFDVKLSDVFGFGTYGKHWILEYYDGKTRAANGFWADSDPNWKFVMPSQRHDFTMKAFEGYILALDLDELTESSSVWNNNVENVYIYFPSTVEVKDIQATNRLVTIDQDGYECTINRPTPDGDRRVKDSYWHCIGVPSFANYSSTLYDDEEGTAIDWSDTNTDSDGDQWTTPNLPYLYEVDLRDKSLSVTSTNPFHFKATWSYLVQYQKSSIYWSNVNVTPAPIVARRSYQEAPTNAEFRIELQQAGEKADQTFVRLTNDEAVTTGFDFNYDLSKEFNKNKANIYTMVTTVKEDGPSITEVAGNVQPMTEQTTVVPMGVTIAKAGEYTISIPSGTSGIGVTLVDNETGIRTNLALEDYAVALEAGTQNDRFYLEISPIKHVATGVEEITGDGSQVTGARKVMVDGILYIIKDGKVFSTQGARVK